ncbi:MAG TPA: non-ribosomal peptide synthetase, partial [Polyangiaceae bacterium]|nr:non-ribosomal peptide synthetase [Polyangiaceae bacterium]
GGEHPPRDLVDWLCAHCAEAWNLYGPTETTIWSLRSRLAAGEPPAIGRPIENTRVFVLDEGGNPLGPGVAGELVIGGEGVAAGYWRRPELTAERFVRLELGGAPASTFYRTGDLVRYRGDGALEYLGRIDAQIKVRGYRIEPGEVEHAMRAHPAVREAAVVARPGPDGGELVAFVCAREGAAPRPAELRDFVKGALPAYMVPGRVALVPELPRTPNGKVHREALAAAPLATEAPGAAYEAPADAVEAAVAALYAELLPGTAPGRHDDFFSLGGHSLMAARLLHSVAQRFDVALPMSQLFLDPTVRGFAAALKFTRLRAAVERGDEGALSAALADLRDDEAQDLLARLEP